MLNAAQRAAVAALRKDVEDFFAREPEALVQHDWGEELKKTKVAYDGSEVSLPEKLTLQQVAKGLPPPGVAASIEAADVATGFVREALLNPQLVLRDEGQRLEAPSRSR
eukprot:3152203-Lingulodinium_polyedra.AAC.1